MKRLKQLFYCCLQILNMQCLCRMQTESLLLMIGTALILHNLNAIPKCSNSTDVGDNTNNPGHENRDDIYCHDALDQKKKSTCMLVCLIHICNIICVNFNLK